MPLSIGLDTGLTGLRAAQTMVDTTAHNIANANTEGYSRQEVLFRAVPPAYSLVKSPGAVNQQLVLGVDTGRIRRLRDQLLDVQYRDLPATRDQAQAAATALGQIEAAVGEPSDEGLQAQLTRFFNAFRDVATAPESTAARAAAVEQGATLAGAFNRVASLLQAQRADLDSSVGVRVDEVNALATEVADLNQRIRIATVAGIESNDVKDRRDLLIDKLAGLTGARAAPLADGMVDLAIGTRKLVDGTSANALATLPNAGNANLVDVVWASDSAVVGMTTGEIRGMLTARDAEVSGMLASLNDLVGALANAVNGAHQAGYGLENSTGLDFFVGTTADTLAVNPTLRASPEKLAVSDAPNEPGNPNGARHHRRATSVADERRHRHRGRRLSTGGGATGGCLRAGAVGAQQPGCAARPGGCDTPIRRWCLD